MAKLNEKVGLITGGSRGIGAAIAKRLAADGASVAITYDPARPTKTTTALFSTPVTEPSLECTSPRSAAALLRASWPRPVKLCELLHGLDGRITQEFFDKQAVTLRAEQDGLLRKIQDIQKAMPAPIDEAIDMLCLTSRASELFLQQPSGEQRRLLQALVKKAAWKEGALETTLFEPFEILRHSNRASTGNEKANPGSGRDLEVWLRN